MNGDWKNISKEKLDKLSAEMVPVDYVREQLHRNEKGKVTQTIENCMLAVQEDSFLRGLVRLNLLSCRMVICKEVPWRRSGAAMTDNDMDNILSYMAQNYDLRNDSLCRRAVSMAANNDSFHPIRDYLNNLEWDGQQRLRHALRHFLGASEDELTYLCLKTYMMGALQRVFWPGCKCEYVLTLIGGQGVGKSTFFRFLAIKDDWFTDDLVDFKSSRIYEKINGHWIIEMPEMLAMMNGKRAEETKAFVSRQSDVYHDPYAVYPADRPRQCVFGATTNRQKCLPFDHTGNRRFLPVTVDLDNADVHILEDEAASREYINQMWAEAMDIFKRRDYMMTFSPEITRQLDQLRQEFMPEDTNAGLIQAYLDEYEGDYVCTTQLYREALHSFGEPTRIESSEIGEIMRYSIQGWKVGPQHRFPIYGQQRSWIRDEDCKQERKRDHPNPEKEQSMLEQGFVPVTDTSDVPFPEAHEPS